ncbi:MAG: hypothetical protein K2M55_06550, partial [Muribaculaceae bacterium]|nr:hypothetical protein [Muribaculaceae bacterium]
MQHFLQPIVFAGFALCFGSALAHDPLAHNPVPAKGDALTADARLGVPAKGATSGAHRLGERTPLVPPFLQVFDDYTSGQEHDLFERYYQIINGDGDKNPSGTDRSWGYYNFNGVSGGRQFSKCAQLQYPINVNVCDDWLIPWAIKLDADKYYYVYMDASLYAEGSTHRFEVKMGRYNDAAGMTTEVIPATDVTSILPTQCGGWFKPDRSGNYYMGIHGISNKLMADGGYLFIDNIGMEAARSGNEPNTVSDVKFTTDPNGRTTVDIEFNAPATSIDGNPLSGSVTVEIRRDGELVKTLLCTPGQQGVKYTDAAPAQGNYQYSFTT